MIVNRRRIIQIAALGAAGFIAQACSKKSQPETNVSGELGADASADAAAANKPLELVSESDSTAVALGYKHDASTVPASEKAEKNGTAGAQQNCSNCAFYAPIEGVDGGKCTLITSGYVKPAGWCKSWSLKQG